MFQSPRSFRFNQSGGKAKPLPLCALPSPGPVAHLGRDRVCQVLSKRSECTVCHMWRRRGAGRFARDRFQAGATLANAFPPKARCGHRPCRVSAVSAFGPSFLRPRAPSCGPKALGTRRCHKQVEPKMGTGTPGQVRRACLSCGAF